MKYKLSEKLWLPEDAPTQTISILARKGAGKTYTGLVIAEEFALAGVPFVFVDPLGAAWGLRVHNVKDFPAVIIIGGVHGDVPLEPTAGKVIADLVVDHPGFYIVDMSLTESNAAQDRFATDFAERLYRRKASHPSPLHVFVDEADSFIPQRPMPGQQRMLGAFEAIVRRGRIRGLGITMITQRAAVLNKNVLSQTELLITLQTTAPNDRRVIEDWVKDKDCGVAALDILTKLDLGQAYIWSPSWLKKSELVQIRKRYTHDSSATPKAGAVAQVKLSQVDIVKLGEEIKATVERAKANDPAHLKKQVAELQNKIHKLENEKPAVPIVPTIDTKLIESVEQLRAQLSHNAGQIEGCKFQLERASAHLESFAARLNSVQTPMQYDRFIGGRWKENPIHKDLRTGRGHIVHKEDLKMVSKCEREILRALAQYPQGRSQPQIAILTGYSSTSGGFTNALAKLRVNEYITRTQPIQITQAGRASVGEVQPLPTGQALIDMWLNQLPRCESAILKTLVDVYPDTLFAAQLGERTGYRHTSGGFANALSRLRTLELIQRGTMIKASDHLFQ